jgi:hypothetical protein
MLIPRRAPWRGRRAGRAAFATTRTPTGRCQRAPRGYPSWSSRPREFDKRSRQRPAAKARDGALLQRQQHFGSPRAACTARRAWHVAPALRRTGRSRGAGAAAQKPARGIPVCQSTAVSTTAPVTAFYRLRRVLLLTCDQYRATSGLTGRTREEPAHPSDDHANTPTQAPHRMRQRASVARTRRPSIAVSFLPSSRRRAR